jgi:hypothetical protein
MDSLVKYCDLSDLSLAERDSFCAQRGLVAAFLLDNFHGRFFH